jgi:hypothetical protein
MGLIDLQTDLTSLKYGDSKPIVKHKIGNKVSQASARVSDVKRIGGILTRAPGIKFGLNQVLLQKAKIGDAASNRSVAGTVLAVVGGAIKASLGQGLFLTANAAKAGTGFHSINPAVAKSYIEPGKEMPQLKGFLGAVQKVTQVVNDVQAAIGVKSAAYHAGKEILGGAKTLGPVKLVDESHHKRKNGDGPDQGTSEIQYKETEKVDKSGGITKAESPNKKIRKEAFDEDIKNFKKYLPLSEENLNYGGKDLPHYYEKGEGDSIQKYNDIAKALGEDEQDIIPFVFNFYTPGEGNTNSFLYFRAFLDSMSDSYTANWSGVKYIGRAEEFFTYNGFGRTMSFAFKAAAFSRQDLNFIYQKLNLLVGGTAPTYGDEGLFMRGTLLKLTIGDYIKDQNGFLSSVSLTWNTDYPWELEGDMKVPHLLDVSCEFTPIHSFNPEFNGKLDNGETKYFIGNSTKPPAKKVEEPSNVPGLGPVGL